MSLSIFEHVELAPRDPILGLTEAFNADQRPSKINLGVGVYYDDRGRIPLLRAVETAEKKRLSSASAHGYIPIEGLASYDKGVQKLLFGAESQVLSAGRVVTLQALGGTGALKLGADFSTPSWENHRALFEAAGFQVGSYPYYDAATNGIDFAGMLAALSSLPAGSIVLLHACCHNPTGVDLDHDQWRQVVELAVKHDLIPFVDIAYQGFGDGLEADRAAIQLFVEAGINFFVASSFSKSFSLYGERVGALSIVTSDAGEATRVLSQIKRTIRTNYSSPPTYGAAVVADVLTTPELYSEWEQELAEMRERIRAMRSGLLEGLSSRIRDRDFSFIVEQRGMFSYSGLTPPQVEKLSKEFAIYAVSTGRICVAALNSKNIGYVCEAISSVIVH